MSLVEDIRLEAAVSRHLSETVGGSVWDPVLGSSHPNLEKAHERVGVSGHS